MELKEDIKEIKKLMLEAKVDELKKKKKKKTPRLPLRGRVGKRQASRGYVAVWKINENGFITPSRQEIKEQTIMVDGVPRLATPEYIMRYKKGFRTYPLIILPSWSVKPVKPEDISKSKEPFNPKDNYDKSMKDGSKTEGYKLLMNKMKLETVQGTKKAIGGLIKWILGLGLLGIIGYAIMTSGGG